jgi:hypothetical protein
MAGPNFAAIFPRLPKVSWGSVITANTAKDGTGTVVTIFTADATNGSRVDRIRMKPLGTTGAASVARFFVNNGSTNTTASNNSLIWEYTLPNITTTEAAAQADFEIQTNMALPPGYKINVTVGTTLTPQGWEFTAFGGDY